ncbi:MAG: hypothetical protein WA824_01815 [Candidatus Sulfotelmatobacter sp.]
MSSVFVAWPTSPTDQDVLAYNASATPPQWTNKTLPTVMLSDAMFPTYTDWTTKIQQSITTYLPNGGIVDARALIPSGGLQNGTVNPFAPGGTLVTVPIIILLGEGTWNTAIPIVIPSLCRLVGEGRGCTTVSAGSGFSNPGGVAPALAVVCLGPGGSTVFGTRVESMTVNGDSVTHVIGVYGTDLQEQCGAFDVAVSYADSWGFQLAGMSEHCKILDCVVSLPTANSPGGLQISSSGYILVERFTATGNNSGTNIGIDIESSPGVVLINCHAEQCDIGFQVNGSTAVTLIQSDVGGAGHTVATGVLYEGTSGGLTILGLRAVVPGNVTYLLDDAVNGNKLAGTYGYLGFYSTGREASTQTVITTEQKFSPLFNAPIIVDAAAVNTGPAASVCFGNNFQNPTGASGNVTANGAGGSGPANPTKIVQFLQIYSGSTSYWIPLMQ